MVKICTAQIENSDVPNYNNELRCSIKVIGEIQLQFSADRNLLGMLGEVKRYYTALNECFAFI